MAHGVDTAVKAMKAALLSTLGDRVLRQSHLDELPRRRNPMLPSRNSRYLPIDWGALVIHEDTKAPRPADSPPLGAEDGLQVR